MNDLYKKKIKNKKIISDSFFSKNKNNFHKKILFLSKNKKQIFFFFLKFFFKIYFLFCINLNIKNKLLNIVYFIFYLSKKLFYTS